MPRVQLAAVVFCDVVRSTDLLVRLGEQRFDAVRRELDRAVENAVHSEGGRVVKRLGDGAMSAFDTPSQAIAASVVLQRTVPALAADLSVPDLQIRVGMSVGEVSEEAGDLHGRPVVEAARLCAAAQPGQVLAAESIATLSRFSEHVLTPIGALDLKGLPEPVHASEVDWRSSAPYAGASELPGALSASAAFAFVGRSAEWEMLARAWASIAERGRHLVLVSGEPGVGKTRVLREFARWAHANGALVLFGACEEEGGLPFQPFVEALDHLVAGRTDLGSHIGQDADAVLARIFPRHDGPPEERRPTTDTVGPDLERERLFQMVTDVLVEAGRAAPVLLVLDDLHWARRPTLQLIVHLMRSPARLRLCVMATYRDAPDDIGPALGEVLPHLHRIEGTTRLHLSGLDRPGISAFVAAAAQSSLDPMLDQVVEILAAQTDGNAFLLCELWRHLIETGQLVHAHGRWRVVGPTAVAASPGVVRSVVGRRIDQLREASREVLDVAAAAGPSFTLDLVAEAIKRDRSLVLEQLERAEANGTIESTGPGTFRFAHALVWRAVYDRLPSSRRARLHLEVAEALARVSPGDRSLPDLARHHLAALPLADTAVVVDVTARAADVAMRSLAYEDATELLAAILPIVTEPARRAELLVRAADARFRAGDAQAALDDLREAVALARRTASRELQVSASIAFETASWRPGLHGGEAEALLREALPLIDDEPTRVRALAAHGRALALAGRSSEAEQVVEDAIARAQEIGDPGLLSFALSTFFNVPWRPERYRLMLQRACELSTLAADSEDPLEAMNAQQWFVLSLILNDEFDQLPQALSEHERIADRTRQPFCRHLSAAARSMRALMEGRFADAEVLANEANELASGLSGVDASGVFGVQMFSLRREQGRLEEVRPVVEMVVEQNRESVTWRPGLAALYAELGLLDEARGQVRELVDNGLTGIARDSLFVGALTYLADAAVATGEQAAAAELYRALEPYRGTPVVLGHLIACYGAADRYLGSLAELVGRGRDAETHYLRAVELDAGARSVTWLAHSRYRYAAFLVRQSRARSSDRARTLLEQVVQTTEEIGMRALHARTAALLAELDEAGAAGTPKSRAARRTAGTLSVREVEVIRCLAIGLTNAEIGSQLHISQHTAANHVRSILMKTGLANRTEVAAWAIRTGVVTYT